VPALIRINFLQVTVGTMSGVSAACGARKRSIDMNAGTLCTRNVVTCGASETVYDAAMRMRRHSVGDLVVVDVAEGATIPTGMITDRDIMLAVVTSERNPVALKVGDIMSSPVVVAHHWEDVRQVVRRMRLNAVRRMPVIGEMGELIGIISIDDLVQAASSFLSELWLVSARQVHFEEKRKGAVAAPAGSDS
jgi:CBS domain-containing protein